MSTQTMPDRVKLFWLRAEREAVRSTNLRRAMLERYAKAAADAQMTLVPVTVDDIITTDAGGSATVWVLGERVDPDRIIFQTALDGSPANAPDSWRHLTTTGILEAAGFCVTVPALHNVTFNDPIATLARLSVDSAPALPTVRLCTREIEFHEKKRFKLSDWGLKFPVAVKPAHWGGQTGSTLVAESERKLSTILQLASASETTVVIQPWLGHHASTRRVHCVEGEPVLGLELSEDHLVSGCRAIAGSIGLPYVRVDFLQTPDQLWLTGVDLGTASSEADEATVVAHIQSYRSLFDRFVSRQPVNQWVYE